MSPDWERIARSLGLISSTSTGGRSEQGGDDHARAALCEILGEEALREAVDHYVSGAPGAELARSVLWLLGAVPAMDRCYEIFRSDADPAVRASAVELLRVVADRRVTGWIPEFLGDPEPEVQLQGMGVIDQLAWSERIDRGEIEGLLDLARASTHPPILEQIAFVERYLADRNDDDES